MADFRKRAAKAAEVLLDPDEEVLAAVNVMASPFIAGAAMVGGAIAGGGVGAAVGAMIDGKHRNKDAGRTLPAVAARTALEPPVPANGALAAVTSKQVLIWRIGGLGKPRDILHRFDLDTLDTFVWEDADTRWLAGRPKSFLMWFGLQDVHVLSAAAIVVGPARKHAEGIVEALASRRPGIVSEFHPDT